MLKARQIRNASNAWLAWLALVTFCFQPIVAAYDAGCHCESDQSQNLSSASFTDLACCQTESSQTCCSNSRKSSCCPGSIASCCASSNSRGCKCSLSPNGCQCEDCHCAGSGDRQKGTPAIPSNSESQSKPVVVGGTPSWIMVGSVKPPPSGQLFQGHNKARSSQETCAFLSRFMC